MKFLLKSNVMKMLLTADTRLLRFWFSLASFGHATWILFDDNYGKMHPLAVQLAPAQALVVLFTVHGVAKLYGVVTGRFSTALLFFEGILGVFLWVGVGLAHAFEQGTPGAMLIAGGGLSLYLLIRYPTHYGSVKR